MEDLEDCSQNRGAINDNNNNMPEVLVNPIYTPAFLRQQIGKLMRVEFLIGTDNMVDKIGILQEVGASYIILSSFEGDTLIYCDIYAIKFISISNNRNMNMNLNNMNNQNTTNYQNYSNSSNYGNYPSYTNYGNCHNY